jgi:hypothetical protein
MNSDLTLITKNVAHVHDASTKSENRRTGAPMTMEAEERLLTDHSVRRSGQLPITVGKKEFATYETGAAKKKIESLNSLRRNK